MSVLVSDKLKKALMFVIELRPYLLLELVLCVD